MSSSNNSTRQDFRHELKIPLQRLQYAEFEAWMQQVGLRLGKTYPDRQVHSVYLDSANLDDYQDNVAGLSKRGKLRLRWYNNASENVVLELKNKRGRLANKLVLDLHNPSGEAPLSRATVQQLLRSNERSIAVARQQHLFPTLHVHYQRSYYEIAPAIRMTLDHHILYQKLYPLQSHNTTTSVVDVVVEFKYPVSHAKIAARLLAGIPARVFRHSKYVIGVDTVCDL